MSLVIDDPEVEALIQRLSEKTGESASETVRKSVAARLERTLKRREAIREAQEAMRVLPPLDSRSAEEIIGYNEHGMFD